jgi:hypothetical protein
MRRTFGSIRSREPAPPLGTMGGRRDGRAVAVLGCRHRRRLVTRPSPADDQRPRTAGRRLSDGQYAAPGPAFSGYHPGRSGRPDEHATPVDITESGRIGRSVTERIQPPPDTERVDPGADPAGSNAEPAGSNAEPARPDAERPGRDANSANAARDSLARRLGACGNDQRRTTRLEAWVGRAPRRGSLATTGRRPAIVWRLCGGGRVAAMTMATPYDDSRAPSRCARTPLVTYSCRARSATPTKRCRRW